MNIRFIPDGPALLVSNRKRILVAADLHIGIEAELSYRGWHVASRTKERLDRLLSCIALTGPDMVFLLGDVKHNLPQTTRQEYRELPEFLTQIRSRVPIRVFPGNHDTGIARFLEKEELFRKDGVLFDGVGYMHGHTIPSEKLAGHLICVGHHHPLAAVRDEVGCALRSPAYLLADLDPASLFGRKKTITDAQEAEKPVREKNAGRNVTRALFMPAFNECAGFDILRIVRHPFSPLSRALIAKSAEVFLPDGTFLGPVSSLEVPDFAA
jgi:metallophosphoesterase superfamily enzyme